MSDQVHQRFLKAKQGQTLKISATEKSASVLYRGEIRRVASDMRLTWPDAEIEDDVDFVFTKAGGYYVEVLVTFVESPNKTTVTVAIVGGQSEDIDLDSANGKVHLISVAVRVSSS